MRPLGALEEAALAAALDPGARVSDSAPTDLLPAAEPITVAVPAALVPAALVPAALGPAAPDERLGAARRPPRCRARLSSARPMGPIRSASFSYVTRVPTVGLAN
ncbi:hypothetical protein GCM10023083_47530 [Streptomyces phyllanthi]